MKPEQLNIFSIVHQLKLTSFEWSFTKDRMKTLHALAMFFSVSAFANQSMTMTCIDQNERLKAPVYFDIEASGHPAPYDFYLYLGNLVDTGETPPRKYKSATVLGYVESRQEQGTNLIVAGSFNTKLVLNRSTGHGLVYGMVKWNPVTGQYDIITLKDYPVVCRPTNNVAKRSRHIFPPEMHFRN